MGISIRRGTLVSAFALAALVGIAAPVHAQGPTASSASDGDPGAVNTAPPAEPEESGLVDDPTPEPLPDETGAPSKPSDTTNAQNCGRTTTVHTRTIRGAES